MSRLTLSRFTQVLVLCLGVGCASEGATFPNGNYRPSSSSGSGTYPSATNDQIQPSSKSSSSYTASNSCPYGKKTMSNTEAERYLSRLENAVDESRDFLSTATRACKTGSQAVSDRFHVKHLHATVLSLMGLPPNDLTYFYAGLDQRLVGVEGAEPIHQIMT